MPCDGPVHLRRASPADAAGIATVHVRCWQDAYRGLIPDSALHSVSVERREAFWRGEMEVGATDRRPWVAFIDERLIGFVSAGLSRDDGAPSVTGEIYTLSVDPDCWRSGIGRNLLQHAERELREHGFTSATLWVPPENRRACHFYERSGWQLDGGVRDADLPGADLAGAELEEVRYRRELA